MKNQILSVGIDIGTTTTQVIFSEIIIQNTAETFLIPKVKITEKKIIYKSKIYFTPLVNRERINLQKLKEIILKEYKAAGINKQEISTGAIIITGETARKENAEEVLNILSDFAGNFVVATAGPDLESMLAGLGAGASEISKNLGGSIINFDIGGGTTNAVVFSEGEAIDLFALDIGGRLIQFDEKGTITYISDKVKKFISSLNLNLCTGMVPEFLDLKILTDAFAKIFIQISENKSTNRESEELFIGHKHKGLDAKYVTFSGGVAEYIYSNKEMKSLPDVFEFYDIGPLLADSIKTAFKVRNIKVLQPKEKIRATVIGAGSHSISISGSTVIFDDDILPIKNIPIIKLFNNTDFENIDNIYDDICEKNKLYENTITAIAFKGPRSPTYIQIKNIAEAIVKSLWNSNNPIIVIVENDFAKALGQTIGNMIKDCKKVICIDGIKVDNGDYVDIGKSISGIVPVVIKTLIF